jgi:hypothetical protein
MDKTRGEAEMAQTVLSTAGASDQVKEAENAFLLALFSSYVTIYSFIQ